MKCECGTEIFFATTVNGKKMPLDAVENPAGNVVLTQTATGTVAMVVRAAPSRGEHRYMPHWATCAKGDQFRRKTSGV